MKIGERFNPFRMFMGAFVPEALCRYRGVSPGAKLVYARLYRFAGERGECFPAVSTIADEIGVGETQARTYLDELATCALIEKESKIGKVNTYFFVWHECFDGMEGDPRKSPPPRKTEVVENIDTPSVNRGPDPLGLPDGTPSVYRGRRESIKESHSEESHFTAQDFLRIHTKAKGSKKASPKERAVITEWIPTIQEPSIDIAAAFGCFLLDEYWRERNFPPLAFKDQFQKYLRLSREMPIVTREEESQQAQAPESSIGSPMLDPGASHVVSVRFDYPARWNELVPASPAEWDAKMGRSRALAECETHPQFRERFDEICGLAQQIHTARGKEVGWMTFHWAIKSVDGVYGWYKILTEHRWMATVPAEKSKSGQRKMTNMERMAAGLPMEG